MNINTLISTLSTAIANDTALTTWANTTYSQDHKVYVNFDSRNPPGEGDCPFVVLYPISKTAGMGITVKRLAFEVDCCINDDSTRSTGQILEYNAVQRIEAFRKLVETAIVSTSFGNALIETVEIEFDVIESFPYAWAGMVIELNEQFYTGSDPLE